MLNWASDDGTQYFANESSAGPNAVPKQGGFSSPVPYKPPFSMRRVKQSVIESHSGPDGERNNQFVQARHGRRRNVNPFRRQDSRADHPKFTSAFRNANQYLSGYPKRSPVHFTTNGELDEDASLNMFSVDEYESMTGTTTTWPQGTEYSSQPNMFISYTLSEDRTGNQDSVMAARLAALGERHKHTGFASASLALLGRR